MKKWHEEKPFTFGIVFLILYTMLDVADARWFIPRMRPVCNGEITDQQAKACSGWIRKVNNKEQNDVRVTKRGLRGVFGNTPKDGFLRDQERAINDFVGKQN